MAWWRHMATTNWDEIDNQQWGLVPFSMKENLQVIFNMSYLTWVWKFLISDDSHISQGPMILNSQRDYANTYSFHRQISPWNPRFCLVLLRKYALYLLCMSQIRFHGTFGQAAFEVWTGFHQRNISWNIMITVEQIWWHSFLHSGELFIY